MTPFGAPMVDPAIPFQQPWLPDSVERFASSPWDATAAGSFQPAFEQAPMNPFEMGDETLRASPLARGVPDDSFPLSQDPNLPQLGWRRVITLGINTYVVYTDSLLPFQILEG